MTLTNSQIITILVISLVPAILALKLGKELAN